MIETNIKMKNTFKNKESNKELSINNVTTYSTFSDTPPSRFPGLLLNLTQYFVKAKKIRKD